MTIFSGLFGSKEEKIRILYQKRVDLINNLEKDFENLSDVEIKEQTLILKNKLTEGHTLESILPEAFSLVREASKRTLGQRHYDVQLIGGMVISEGKIAEMRTGEGKTLVSTLPAYLHALKGEGVHIVTVNDYLARRDATWMGQVFDYLGLTVSVINGQEVSYRYDSSHITKEDQSGNDTESFHVVYEKLRPITRKEAYECDITYGTNSEFGFDYLKDNLVTEKEQINQRNHYFAIVDEIDSILIDEARTPLIISSADEDSGNLYKTCSGIANSLRKDVDYTIDEKLKAIQLTDEGINKAEKVLGIGDIYTEKGIKYVHHLETAVRAQSLYVRDKDYVVQDGKIVIVDSFTGRLQPGRRWSDGLHQAIEAKENVLIERETRAVASITYQNFFRFYKILAGMTGTAETSKEEFYKVYKLDVITIPTHRKIKRIDNDDLIFQTEKGKFQAIAKKAKELQEKGQPVLIGTVSIEKNELLGAYLLQEGVHHTMLNAKNHEREAEIIAQAGKKGSVVVATNMAGRGIDIMLGGNPSTKEEQEEVKNLGGLFVLGTERHEARRIDNQLRGRAGRQGDNGETIFYVSLEDDLMRIFGSEKLKTMMGRFGIPEDQPIQNSWVSRSLETAQSKIEGFHFDSRKHTLEYDMVLSHQRNIIYTRRKKFIFGTLDDIELELVTLSESSDLYKNILKTKIEQFGRENLLEHVRKLMLYVIDVFWTDHLELMEYSRSSVNLRAYGQHEPLVEYKKEGLKHFKLMEQSIVEEFFTRVEQLESQKIQ